MNGAANGFVLRVQAATRAERFEDVRSFVGEDASGSFGILPGHDRFMTALVFGLARFRSAADGDWRFLALPGALLYFAANELTLNTRRYLLDTDYERVSAALSAELLAEEELLRSVKESLRHMEDQMLKRLWELRRRGEKGL